MTTILCSIPHPHDSTNLYRGTAPLQTLKRSVGNIELGINPDINWMMLKAADIIFFQRPCIEPHLKSLQFAKSMGKPIWLDYDDYLHGVPTCNRRYPTYGHPHVQHNIATMIAMADVVTVSCDYLGDRFRDILKQFPDHAGYVKLPEKFITVPNAYDPEMHGALDEKRQPRTKKVVWRGSDSHCRDLHTHTKPLIDIVKTHQDWNYEFIGEPFWLMMDELKKVARPNSVSVTHPMDPVTFFRYLKKQAPTVMIVPLEDIPFNRAKSNIAWIEATMSGAVTIAPDWPEWKKPGVITYSNLEEFQDKLEAVLEDDLDTDKLWKCSREYIAENLMLNQVNISRYLILQELNPSLEKVLAGR